MEQTETIEHIQCWTKMLCFQQKRKWRILCLVLWVAESSRHSVRQMYTAEQNVHLQDFCEVCLIGKILPKFCKKNPVLCFKNSDKLLNKFNAGQKSFVF